jgi:hypothetical protein
MVGQQMNCKLERVWKEAVVAQSRHHPGTYLEGLRKAMERHSQDSLIPKHRPVGVVTAAPAQSVRVCECESMRQWYQKHELCLRTLSDTDDSPYSKIHFIFTEISVLVLKK